jgi:Lrp/AsnC family transcriptional regulator, leucine-responsive regulatory protein
LLLGIYSEPRLHLRKDLQIREKFVENTALDVVDFQIINALLRNGRASFASLGDQVGLSPHGASDRVRRLVKAGVITGFTVRLSLADVGRALDASIDVRLLPTTAPDEFEAFASRLEAVQEISFVTGRFDYQVRVACRDRDDLDRTVRALRRDGGAMQTETRIVLRATSVTKAIVDADRAS